MGHGTNKVQVVGSGTFWAIGWLFTVGFANLGFFKGVLAMFVWPYFLGQALA